MVVWKLLDNNACHLLWRWFFDLSLAVVSIMSLYFDFGPNAGGFLECRTVIHI